MAGESTIQLAEKKKYFRVFREQTVLHIVCCCFLPLVTLFFASCIPSMSVQTKDQQVQQAQPTTAEIQQLLINAGYNPGPVDGIAGPKTARALRRFQHDQGIPLTGKPDPATCTLLSAYTDKIEVVRRPPRKKTTENTAPKEKAGRVVVSQEPSPSGVEESVHAQNQQAASEKSGGSGATSALKSGGAVVSTVGNTLEDIGEEHKGSFIGSSFSLAGKIYSSIGNTIETGAGEMEEGKEISFTEANKRAAVGVGGAIQDWAGEQGQDESGNILTAQRKLKRLGYYSGTEDGVLGPETRQAICRYQEAKSLAVTGEIDEETLQALGSDD